MRANGTRYGQRASTAARCAVARWLGSLVLVVLAMLAPLSSASAEPRSPAPKRIVSLNLCTDQLLVDLVGRERIAAVSRLAADASLSAVTDRLAGIQTVAGSAEEVLALQPDLVLTGEYSTPHVVSLLQKLGVRVEVIPLASDIAGIRSAIGKVAASVGEEARGRAVIADFDARIEASTSPGPLRPTALAYQFNSLTAGPGGLIDAMMAAAGFRNMAGEHRLGPAGRLPLESFVARPPDLVVLANSPSAFRTVSADNLRHPAMRELMRRRPTAEIAMPLWLCGTPAVARGIERLAQERRAIAATTAARTPMPPRNGGATVLEP